MEDPTTGNYIGFDVKDGEEPSHALMRCVAEKKACPCEGHDWDKSHCHCGQCCNAPCQCHSRIDKRVIVTKEALIKFGGRGGFCQNLKLLREVHDSDHVYSIFQDEEGNYLG